MADRKLVDNLIDSAEDKVPYDLGSEKALLSLCLKKDSSLNTILRSALTADDFYDERNRIIYQAISELYMNSKSVDRYLVNDYLTKKGQSEKVGGLTYLGIIDDSLAISANIDSYIEIVLEKSKLRRLIKVFGDLEKMAQKAKGSVKDIVDIAIGELSNMREAEKGSGFESLNSILQSNIKEISKIKSGQYSGSIVKTGFSYLDHLLGGLRPGTLNIIAARPGMGKTSFVLNIATNVAELYGVNVDIFSLEMSRSEVGNRIISARTTTSSKKLQNANITDTELLEVAKAVREIGKYPIYIDDNSSVNPVSMMSACKQLKANGELGLIIVDYLQLMSMPGNKGSSYSRQNEISDISRSLKVMAKDLGVPVIALSQLARGAEKRDDHTPMLSDLRDSGAIEQDADSVIFIDRDDYYDKEKRANPIQDAKIIVAKNRHGEPGVVKLKWCGARTLFYEEERDSDPKEPQVSPYARTTTPGGAASDYKFDVDEQAASASQNPGPESAPASEPAPFAPIDSYEEPAEETEENLAYSAPDNDEEFDSTDFATELPESWG